MALDYVDDTILWVLFVIEIFESILVNLDDFKAKRHPRILVFLNLDYEVNIREEIYLKLEIWIEEYTIRNMIGNLYFETKIKKKTQATAKFHSSSNKIDVISHIYIQKKIHREQCSTGGNRR